MDHLNDLREFIIAAYESGQDYEEVRSLLKASGWIGAEEYLATLWEELEHPPSPPAPLEENTSGTGGELPPEVAALRFSWGAFSLTWIWGIANNVKISYWFLALDLIRKVLPNGYISYVAVTLIIAAQVWLGLAGHKLVWQHRRFSSVKQYQETMRAWDFAGAVLFIIGAAVFLGYVVWTLLSW